MELEETDKEFLDNRYVEHKNAMPGIMDRWRRGMSMEPTVDRVVGFISGAYWYSLMTKGLEDDKKYIWEYGDTVDHCSHCSGYVAEGAKPASYWVSEAAKGFYPGSPALECFGLHCGCNIVGA